MSILLPIVYGCFHGAKAELSHWNRDHMTGKKIYILLSGHNTKYYYRKRMLIPVPKVPGNETSLKIQTRGFARFLYLLYTKVESISKIF